MNTLTGLSELYLNDNTLFGLPIEICDLRRLEVLRLSNNRLKELPKDLGNMAQLRRLYLAGNLLSRLPDSIGQLTRLEDLGLTNNVLVSLPDSIGKLVAIKKILVADNELRELPESIGQLETLGKLVLQGNRLTALPETMGRLCNLRNITVRGNILQDPPREVVDVPDWKRARMIVEYFRGRRATLRWHRSIHTTFGRVGNQALFVTVACSNRIFEWDAKMTSVDFVRYIPPEIWDFIFQMLSGTSFDSITRPESVRLDRRQMARSGTASPVRVWGTRVRPLSAPKTHFNTMF
jgi:hypothetical protein